MNKKIVFISDIHANLEALRAVLSHIGDDVEIISLGDVIGRGPNPRECLDLLKERRIYTLVGNHEVATYDSEIRERMCGSARRWLDWTILKLKEELHETDWFDVFENDLVSRRLINDGERKILLVHASPINSISGYNSIRDAILALNGNTRRFDKIMSSFEDMNDMSLCFYGHTHYPGIIMKTSSVVSPLGVFYPAGSESEFSINEDDVQYMVNPGSVGAPRDDFRASYCVYHPQENKVVWYRVEYDVETTLRKMRNVFPDIDQMDNILAQ